MNVALFDTRAEAEATSIPNDITVVRTEGFSALGDGGAAAYVRLDTDADTTAILASFTVPADLNRQLQIVRAVQRLKAEGVWGKLDLLYIMAAHDEQAGRINWRDPGTSTLTAVNSPDFQTDRGFKGNGSSAYLDTGVPGASLPSATTSDFHMGAKVTESASGESGALVGSMAGNTCRILFNDGASGFNVRVLDSTSSGGFATESDLKHFVASRLGSNRRAYRDGVKDFDQTISHGSFPASNLGFLRHDTSNYSNRRLGAGHLGRNLTDGEAAALYEIVREYLAFEPIAAGAWQDVSGAWWLLDASERGRINLSAFGVFPDVGSGYSIDPGDPNGWTLIADFPSETDQSTALQAAADLCAARDWTLCADWRGADRAVHGFLRVPSHLKLEGIDGSTLFDPESGRIVDLNRTWLRAPSHIDRAYSALRFGGHDYRGVGAEVSDLVVDFNTARWTVSGAAVDVFGRDAVCVGNCEGARLTRVGGVNGYRHAFNTQSEETRSGTPGVYPNAGKRPKNLVIDDCWGAWGRDDSFTTHGTDDSLFIRCKGYHSLGLYTSNSNPFEIDDDTVNCVFVDPLGVHGAVGLQIKGHSDAKAPRDIGIFGVVQVRHVARGMEAYHTGHGAGNRSPSASNIYGRFSLDVRKPLAYLSENMGALLVQSYDGVKIGEVYFDGGDGAPANAHNIIQINEGAEQVEVGTVRVMNAQGYWAVLRVTSTAGHPGKQSFIKVGDVIADDGNAPSRGVYHSGGARTLIGDVRVARDGSSHGAGAVGVEYTNDTINFVSIGSVIVSGYTTAVIRNGVSRTNGSRQFPGQLIWTGNAGNVAQPNAAIHIGAVEGGAAPGRPYGFFGSTLPSYASQAFLAAYATGNTTGIATIANNTALREHLVFEDPNGVVGWVITGSGNMTVGDPGAARASVVIDMGAQAVRPAVAQDNLVNLGTGAARWKTVYTGTGTINTSDAMEKSIVGPLDEQDALLDAVGSCALLLYQWVDAIAMKGIEEARLHVGTTAQALHEALINFRLDPARYAVFCADTVMEPVEVEVEEEVQAVEIVDRLVTRVVIEGSVARQITEIVPVEVPLWDELPLVDAEGEPVMEMEAGEEVIRDDEGFTIQSRPRRQAVHRIPRTTKTTRLSMVERPKVDSQGQLVTRLGLRYDQVSILLHAWARRELSRLARRVSLLEKKTDAA